MNYVEDKSVTSLTRLQAWYFNQCDGDWEHQFGVKIDTLDNPGWSLHIDLSHTSLNGREFQPIKIERSENDWVFASRTATKFELACGPVNLEEGVALFCDW